jgi:signal transduction histidine kinase
MPDRPSSAITERRFAQITIGALLLGFVFLAATAGVALWLVARADEFRVQVEHTYQVLDRLNEYRTEIERAEAARRGFLLTGDRTYVAVYQTSAGRMPALLKDLRGLTADNPTQQRRLDVLVPLTEQEASLLQRSMDAARGGAGDEAVRIFKAESNDLVQTVRTLTAEMMAEEDRLLAARNTRQAENARLLLGVVVAVTVLLGVLAAFSFGVMRRYARDLESSRARLRSLNQGLEAAVAARTADLTRANAEIQRFAYIVSHDLRSPLVNVMGFTSELELALKPMQALVADAEAASPELVTRAAKEAVETDAPEAIGFIRSSTQKMDRLINAILALSRQGRRALSPEPLELDGLLEGLADTLRHRLQELGAEIVIEKPLPRLTADRLAVEQIVGNLLDNAVKYLKPGRPGRIVVRGRQEAGRTLIEVEDNGRGVDPKDHERIFELFRRSGAQDQPGEGIGLAHVRALAYRLGGTIECRSALDQGATFQVSLPTIASKEAQDKETTA